MEFLCKQTKVTLTVNVSHKNTLCVSLKHNRYVKCTLFFLVEMVYRLRSCLLACNRVLHNSLHITPTKGCQQNSVILVFCLHPSPQSVVMGSVLKVDIIAKHNSSIAGKTISTVYNKPASDQENI